MRWARGRADRGYSLCVKISLEKEFLFVHVPKTGGTSLGAILRPYCIEERIRYPARLLSRVGLVPSWRWYNFRTPAALSVAERWMPAELFDRLLKFAVVRNPWAALASHYHNRMTSGRRVSALKMRAHGSFSNYIRWEADVRGDLYQTRMLTLADGSIGVDRVLRFERLAADWAPLARELGVEERLPHWNRSGKGDWRTLYSDEDAAFVADRWAEDIANFGYSFDDAATAGSTTVGSAASRVSAGGRA